MNFYSSTRCFPLCVCWHPLIYTAPVLWLYNIPGPNVHSQLALFGCTRLAGWQQQPNMMKANTIQTAYYLAWYTFGIIESKTVFPDTCTPGLAIGGNRQYTMFDFWYTLGTTDWQAFPTPFTGQPHQCRLDHTATELNQSTQKSQIPGSKHFSID